MNSFVDIPAMVAACRAACGMVHLVGAGPGDPELLTLRAARLLGQADVVVYDHLVGPEVLALIGADAERIYVGKERSRHSMAQHDINLLLVRLAREGKQVRAPQGRRPLRLRPRRRGAAGAAAAGVAVRGGARHHRRLRRGQLCRHPADPPRLRAELHLRHRPPEGRQLRPRLAGAGAPAPDRGDLHGPVGSGRRSARS